MTDLRGYGDSSKPPGGENHVNYSKRAMALDQIEVMRAYGYAKFAVVGHDRGARVAWRLAIEHREAISRAVVIDIVPLPYSNVTKEFAELHWHWLLLSQRPPIPETLIGNSPEFWMRTRLPASEGITPEAFSDYLRCNSTPDGIRGYCEDFRAGATIDIAHAREHADKKVECPLLILWGQRGSVARLYDVMKVWKEHGTHVSGKALPGRHFLPEESPDETIAELLAFL